MAGPNMSVYLPTAPTIEVFHRLIESVSAVSNSVSDPEFGDLDASIIPDRVGVVGDFDSARPFLLSLSGPGFNDDGEFEEDIARIDDSFAAIGFRPKASLSIYAGANEPVDHQVTVYLAALCCELFRGIALIELPQRVSGKSFEQEGFKVRAPKAKNLFYCDSRFLRHYATTLDFRLVS